MNKISNKFDQGLPLTIYMIFFLVIFAGTPLNLEKYWPNFSSFNPCSFLSPMQQTRGNSFNALV